MFLYLIQEIVKGHDSTQRCVDTVGFHIVTIIVAASLKHFSVKTHLK